LPSIVVNLSSRKKYLDVVSWGRNPRWSTQKIGHNHALKYSLPNREQKKREREGEREREVSSEELSGIYREEKKLEQWKEERDFLLVSYVPFAFC